MKRLVAILLVGWLLAGCNSNMSELKAWVASIKARESSDIKPMPEIEEYHAFVYRPAGRRSPFTPFELTTALSRKGAGSGITPDFDRPREPLEEFPLDALTMVGTMTFGGTRFALIKAPDGVLYHVSVGDHMGLDYGTVIAVKPNRVRLMEIVPNGAGGYMKRPASIAMSPE